MELNVSKEAALKALGIKTERISVLHKADPHSNPIPRKRKRSKCMVDGIAEKPYSSIHHAEEE